MIFGSLEQHPTLLIRWSRVRVSPSLPRIHAALRVFPAGRFFLSVGEILPDPAIFSMAAVNEEVAKGLYRLVDWADL